MCNRIFYIAKKKQKNLNIKNILNILLIKVKNFSSTNSAHVHYVLT